MDSQNVNNSIWPNLAIGQETTHRVLKQFQRVVPQIIDDGDPACYVVDSKEISGWVQTNKSVLNLALEKQQNQLFN